MGPGGPSFPGDPRGPSSPYGKPRREVSLKNGVSLPVSDYSQLLPTQCEAHGLGQFVQTLTLAPSLPSVPGRPCSPGGPGGPGGPLSPRGPTSPTFPWKQAREVLSSLGVGSMPNLRPMCSSGDEKWGKADGVHSDLRTKDTSWSRGACLTLEALRRETKKCVTWEEERRAQGARERAQWAECSPCKQGDPSSAFQHPCRKPVVLSTFIPMLGRQRPGAH